MNRINPKILFVVSIIIVVPLLVLLFASLGSFRTSPMKQGPGKTGLSPTPYPTLPPGAPRIDIIRSSPLQDGQVYLPVQPVEFTFSGPIVASEVKIETEPATKTTIRKGTIDSSVVVTPENSWASGDTTITVLPTTFSSGKRLAAPYSYILRSGIPATPAHENENY